jgi:hypothetical protein
VRFDALNSAEDETSEIVSFTPLSTVEFSADNTISPSPPVAVTTTKSSSGGL